MKELQYKIAITLLPLIGDVNAKKLIAYCGSCEAVFNQKKSHLMKIPGIGEVTADTIISEYSTALKRAEVELVFIEKHKIEPLFFLDENYPNRLKHCPDSPIMLYHKGNTHFKNEKCIAIVGTRNVTENGRKITDRFVEELAVYNPLIISGLAYGVDICAHKSALKNQLQTVGVLAHGLDKIYPSQHKETAKAMLDSGGLLTDYLSKTNPDRENFPSRNRIVAGLVDAVIVIEAGNKGGALITAEIANTYSRDVFAVPGRIDDVYSQGCNKLIKQNKAALIDSAEDIAYICGWQQTKKQTKKQQQLFIDLNEEEQKVVDILKEKKQVAIDELSLFTAFSMSKLSGVLLNLEFKSAVKSLPGKIYSLAN
jgi:DNA processing protein